MRISDWSSDVCSSDLAMGAEIPLGVQGRSLWPILQGKPYPADEFRSIYAGVGVGGLYYDEKDDIALRPKRATAAHGGVDAPNRLSGDTPKKVMQSGNVKMVRMGEIGRAYDRARMCEDVSLSVVTSSE